MAEERRRRGGEGGGECDADVRESERPLSYKAFSIFLRKNEAEKPW